MKYFGSIMAFTRERNRDLMRAFHQQLAFDKHVIAPALFKRVAESPAARFWVSAERAAIVFAAMDAGRPLPRMRDNKREMFQELYRRYLIEKNAHPDLPVYQLADMVVTQPAPKFYLTPRTVGELIYRIRSGWYDRQFDRYRNIVAGDDE